MNYIYKMSKFRQLMDQRYIEEKNKRIYPKIVTQVYK